MNQLLPEKNPENVQKEDKNKGTQTESHEELPRKQIQETLKKLRQEMLAQNSQPGESSRELDSPFRRMMFSVPLFLIFWLLFWYFYLK